MPVSSQGGVMTRCASVDIATYYFNARDEGVTERSLWTLALWLDADIDDARLGFAPDDLPPWPEIGAISLVPPGTPLHWRTGRGYVRSIICRYTLDAFRMLTGIDDETINNKRDRLLTLDGVNIAPIRASITQMATELASPRRASTLLIESLCVQAAVHLARAMLDGDASAPEIAPDVLGPVQDPLFPTQISATGGLTPRQLRVMTDNAERLATGDWQISDAAQVCGISPSHLARAFKQSVGMTLRQYLEGVRLRLARGWLAEGSDSISDIAARLGFAHASAFSIAFKRNVGLSPRVFRRHGGVVPSGLPH
jgi:AraC family transcriptional regulator